MSVLRHKISIFPGHFSANQEEIFFLIEPYIQYLSSSWILLQSAVHDCSGPGSDSVKGIIDLLKKYLVGCN